MRKLVYTVVGARPQFIKAGALSRVLSRTDSIEERIIHTGQHYDDSMSAVFFEQLDIPMPWKNLEVGSGTHGSQTALMMTKLEEIFSNEPPDAVITYGDTNSTLASALVASKMHIPLVHVEAGLRSFNRKMPEEVNRVLTDHVSDLLFCPAEGAAKHLASEGITSGVHVVGDVMYDALLHSKGVADANSQVLQQIPYSKGQYLVATLHRAETTDVDGALTSILQGMEATEQPIVLPLHPRTAKVLRERQITLPTNVTRLGPLPYLDMVHLVANSSGVITDSGGLQKEAFWMSKPCTTVRSETEWTELVELGWNRVVGSDPVALKEAVLSKPIGQPKPVYGTGDSAAKIVEIVSDFLRDAQ